MSNTATVEVLAAEVRVLKVGSRQVTMSVYNQLDTINDEDIEPFGRVRAREHDHEFVYVVGRDQRDGTLARSRRPAMRRAIHTRVMNEAGSDEARRVCAAMQATRTAVYDECWVERNPDIASWWVKRVEELEAAAGEWKRLPLIVLAGLRLHHDQRTA